MHVVAAIPSHLRQITRRGAAQVAISEMANPKQCRRALLSSLLRCFLALLACLRKSYCNCLFPAFDGSAFAAFRRATLVAVHLIFHFSTCAPRIFSSHDFSPSSRVSLARPDGRASNF